MWDGYLIVIALVAALTKLTAAERKSEWHALDAARSRNWRGRKSLREILEQSTAGHA